jgi:hypothetical protein
VNLPDMTAGNSFEGCMGEILLKKLKVKEVKMVQTVELLTLNPVPCTLCLVPVIYL